MKVDAYGLVSITESEFIQELYSNKKIDLSALLFENKNEADRFNRAKNQNKDDFDDIKEYQQPLVSLEEFDTLNQKNWFMPTDYCPNLIESLFKKCQTEEQRDRVAQELELFVQHNMLDLLFYLKYLVDTMKQNSVLAGVGRGSSVSSYVLFLLGIHKIDSLKYNLDIHEFFK